MTPRRVLFHCLLLLFCFRLSASHIVGGEMIYDYLGPGSYRVTLKIYRDCLNGMAPFDGLPDNNNVITPAIIYIFDGSGNYVTQDTLGLPVITQVPSSINNPCITSPNLVCIEEGVYTATLSITPPTGGYYLVYQTCCRSAATLNLLNPTTLGASYFSFIPGPEVAAVNSSPRFTRLPPLYLCDGIPINFNHVATDPDGDMLVYSLCPPYQGSDPCCRYSPTCSPNCPPNNSPPYPPVNFISPFTSSYPLASSPALNINASTGLLDGIPTLQGNWAVGVQVQEFRNNILISTHFRDYMFNVVPCVIPVASIIQSQLNGSNTSLCRGNTISFVNESIGGNTYHWDFGVPSLSNDTSNLTNPTYTYPDTGAYVVMLIVNPGTPCVDTSRKTFYIYPKLAPTFTAPPPQCITNNSFSFHAGGLYAPYTSFTWYFGTNVSPPVSYSVAPTNVVYTQPGKFLVTLIAQERICSDTLHDTVKVFPKPTVKFDSTTYSSCDPAIVTFNNITPDHYPTTYLWKFSDGGVSTLKDPTHTFSPVGTYSTSVMVITNDGCIDTFRVTMPGFVVVNPSPKAGFHFLPDSTTIFDPDIYFFDESANAVTWNYDFKDGASSTMVNPSHEYQTWGDFDVMQTVTNQFGCTDAVTHLVRILPEFRYWVPNTFTPHNKDGLNDEFIPITFGVEDYKFSVFNRWGECVYRTTEPNKGWNGTFGGSASPQDVYTYMITFKNVVTLEYEQHYGSVTLLK